MGYTTKGVKRKRHNYNRTIEFAARLGGAQVMPWLGGRNVVVRIPNERSHWGFSAVTLWKYAAKKLGVKF